MYLDYWMKSDSIDLPKNDDKGVISEAATTSSCHNAVKCADVSQVDSICPSTDNTNLDVTFRL